MFEGMSAAQGVPDEESEPFLSGLDEDDILRTVHHCFRALPLWSGERFDAVAMPTTFIWPTGSENVSNAAAPPPSGMRAAAGSIPAAHQFRPPPCRSALRLVELSIDGTPCGREPFTSTGVGVGMDRGSAVSPRYNAPFAYTGTLHDVTVQRPGGRDPKSDEAMAQSEWSRQ